MKKAIAGIVIVGMLTSGCTGSFQLTRKVYNFHRSQSDKWMDEVLFLVVALVPVYSLASLADAVVFNSIEFWTGKNPVETASQPVQRRIVQDHQTLVLSYNPTGGQIAVAGDKETQPRFVLERTGNSVIAKDAAGKILLTSQATPEGGIEVHDQQDRLVKAYSADEVQHAKLRALAN